MTKISLTNEKYYIFNRYGINNTEAYNAIKAIKEAEKDSIYAMVLLESIQQGVSIDTLLYIGAISKESCIKLNSIFIEK